MPIPLFYHNERQKATGKAGECVGEKKKQYFFQLLDEVMGAEDISDRAKIVFSVVWSIRVRKLGPSPTAPTAEFIARLCGRGRKQGSTEDEGRDTTYVNKGLRELERKGLIRRRKMYRKGSRQVEKRIIMFPLFEVPKS